jgi:hypothetical protein
MARITVEQAQAWLETTKLSIDTLDENLLDELETEILARLGASFDTGTWLDDSSTPKLVRTAIAKMYAAWVYNRTYSEDTEGQNAYAAKLEANAEMLISGMLDGTIDIPGVDPGDPSGQPSYYPNDLSSAMEATADDRSLGPAVFSMGNTF